MKQKVLIVSSTNLTPQQELNEELGKLPGDWKIVSAVTALVPYGQFKDTVLGTGRIEGRAMHVYYVTTAIVEQVGKQHGKA